MSSGTLTPALSLKKGEGEKVQTGNMVYKGGKEVLPMPWQET